MTELDEKRIELIKEQGDCVCSLFWDSGGPGAGADYEQIYKYKDEYWQKSSVDGFNGPYDTLKAAMNDFIGVTGATVSIDCRELSSGELASTVEVMDVEPGHQVELNGEEWEVSDGGRLRQRPSDVN